MSGAGERESSERLSRDYQEILRVEAATPRTARSVGVSGMHHRTTVRGVDPIGGIVSAGDARPAFAGYGVPGMEGKVTRVGASKRGQRASFN